MCSKQTIKTLLSDNVSKNHVDEFCSKIRKEKKSVAIVVSFQNTVLHDIFLYVTLITHTTCPG